MEFGVDPRAVGEMSMYEIFSTFSKMAKKDAPMSDDKYDALLDAVANMNLPDVRL